MTDTITLQDQLAVHVERIEQSPERLAMEADEVHTLLLAHVESFREFSRAWEDVNRILTGVAQGRVSVKDALTSIRWCL